MEITDDITTAALKGFCSTNVCWQMLHDISAQLAEMHEHNLIHGHIDLKHITVLGHHFYLKEEKNPIHSCREEDIWSLAAATFELMMGSPVFNGGGEAAQHENTPIPSLPQPEAGELNKLITKCLNHQKKERPSAKEIMDIASENLKISSSKKREARAHSIIKSSENQTKTDLQWPEKMISSIVKHSIVLLLLLMNLNVFSQIPMDGQSEMVTQKLLDAVLLLRNKDIDNWNTAQDEFGKYLSQITLMNELQDRNNDCPLVNSQVKTFGVNRIVTGLKKGQRVQTSGQELLDGSDVRFSYSLFEKAIKKGCTANYSLSDRYGKQVFLIVPHSAHQAYNTELIREDGTKIVPSGKDANGITYYLIDADKGPHEGEELYLRITNNDKENNASFVIINHNYRDKK